MAESSDIRRALGSMIDMRGREATRRVSLRQEHQLIGSITKRPD